MNNKNEYPAVNKVEDVFSIYKIKKGQTIQLGDPNENKTIFILKGQIEVTNLQKEKILLRKDYMYSLSKSFDKCNGVPLEDSIFVVFYTDSMLPYVDLDSVNALRYQKGIKIEELSSLKIPRLLKKFLASIISLKRENITSIALYNIKIQELLMILRNTVDKEDISRFYISSILANSGFKSTVLSLYSESTNVKELADKCFMTTKTFTRHFKCEFGETPHKWLADKKKINLSDDIRNKSFPLSLILTKYGFLSKNDLRKFCQRSNLNDVIEYLNTLETQK